MPLLSQSSGQRGGARQCGDPSWRGFSGSLSQSIPESGETVAASTPGRDTNSCAQRRSAPM